MSSHALIARRTPSGGYEAIYLLKDGYRAERVLHPHYQELAKINALFALGTITELGPELSDCQVDPDQFLKPNYTCGTQLQLVEHAISNFINEIYVWDGNQWLKRLKAEGFVPISSVGAIGRRCAGMHLVGGGARA